MRQSGFQYPAQDGAYKVKVKSEQSTHNWQNFDHARLQISVGQEYHEGDKLEAMLDWAAPRFETIDLCVNDTLQRFNLIFEHGVSRFRAHDVAREEGDKWVERNRSYITRHPNVRVRRWEDWKKDLIYKDYKFKIETLYYSDEAFKGAITDNIYSIWARRQATNPELYTSERFQDFFEMSKIYLLEEITVFALMFERKTGIDIYPGTVLFAATAFQNKSLPGAPEGLSKGRFCRIDFSRNKNAHNRDTAKAA